MRTRGDEGVPVNAADILLDTENVFKGFAGEADARGAHSLLEGMIHLVEELDSGAVRQVRSYGKGPRCVEATDLAAVPKKSPKGDKGVIAFEAAVRSAPDRFDFTTVLPDRYLPGPAEPAHDRIWTVGCRVRWGKNLAERALVRDALTQSKYGVPATITLIGGADKKDLLDPLAKLLGDRRAIVVIPNDARSMLSQFEPGGRFAMLADGGVHTAAQVASIGRKILATRRELRRRAGADKRSANGESTVPDGAAVGAVHPNDAEIATPHVSKDTLDHLRVVRSVLSDGDMSRSTSRPGAQRRVHLMIALLTRSTSSEQRAIETLVRTSPQFVLLRRDLDAAQAALRGDLDDLDD